MTFFLGILSSGQTRQTKCKEKEKNDLGNWKPAMAGEHTHAAVAELQEEKENKEEEERIRERKRKKKRGRKGGLFGSSLRLTASGD